jgi:hypothetical protein
MGQLRDIAKDVFNFAIADTCNTREIWSVSVPKTRPPRCANGEKESQPLRLGDSGTASSFGVSRPMRARLSFPKFDPA